MSWWTDNRKKIIPALGLLGLNAIPGVGQAASAALSSATGGLLGTAEGLSAAKALGQASMAVPGGLNAALAAEGGSEAGLAGLDAIAKAKFGSAALPIGQAANVVGGGLNAVNRVSKPMMMANSAMGGGLFGGQQPMAPPPRPQAAPVQPAPVSQPYGNLMGSPPPGVDPRQWAMMSPEQKRMMMMGGRYG